MRFLLFALLLHSTVGVLAQKGQTVYISDSFTDADSFRTELSGKGITIMRTSRPEFRIVTVIYSPVDAFRSFDEWKTAAGIEILKENNTVLIRNKGEMDTVLHPAGWNKKDVSDSKGAIFFEKGSLEMNQVLQSLRREALIKKKYLPASFLVFIPKGVPVKINNQGGLVELKDSLDFLSLDGRNVDVIGSYVGEADLRLDQSTAQFRKIQNATIELRSTSLTADTVQYASVRAVESIIHMNTVKSMALNSNLDEISIQVAGSLTGTKKFGRLKVGLIRESLDLAAENTNLSIDRISDTVRKLNLQDRYAEILLNVSLLRSFTINITGQGNRTSMADIPALMGVTASRPSNDTRTFRLGPDATKSTRLLLRCQGCLIYLN